MNISQMMRTYLGEAAGNDTRALELKTGQTVRGVVLQVMENNEAIVQINGVQVRAKLEIPLQQGQTALMQVQPQSSGAIIVLKQVEPSTLGMPDENFKEWAKALSLPETKWALALIKDLRREGLVLTKEVSQAFQQAAAAMPEGGDIEQWMHAAAAAHKRGLPMTGAVVASLQQVMFGQDAHELLDTLQKQLAGLSKAMAGQDGKTAAEAKALPPAAARVAALLAEGAELLRRAVDSSATADSEPQTGSAKAVIPAQAGKPEVPAQAATAASTTIAAAAQGEGAEDAANAQASSRPSDAAGSKGSQNWIGQMMKWLGVDHELQLAKATAASDVPAGARTAAPAPQADGQSQAVAGESVSERNIDGDGAEETAARPAASATRGAESERSIGGTQPKLHQSENEQAIGVQARVSGGTAEEHQTKPAADMRPGMERTAGILQQANAPGTEYKPEIQIQSKQAQQTQQSQQHESLKSALLSLLSSNDTPAAIKETAQQLVAQITGQQLLLTPERNSSILTHVTMFIPFNGQDGNQTASVHIQTRRGRKGELDASNCRLLFNLSMNNLGDTMVDVNVVDKIVSLNLWNDHPAIGALAEASRLEVTERLQEAGYQLLTLRATPLPKPGAETEQKQEQGADKAKKPQAPPDLSQFSATRYKGVDYKI
ncbi:hypothetical protein [Paenibacillus harenae]|uniref:Flagellar hook-length control protein FliK n=1 Tax=Paenibacillus harenae TaxID=306543 RepID=A0ABT9U097_PAEHA|nr:hypothetical protein [Paenibacillus harenae]MDQ0113057.1 hypothetical protein [Paenibacillus harenae]